MTHGEKDWYDLYLLFAQRAVVWLRVRKESGQERRNERGEYDGATRVICFNVQSATPSRSLQSLQLAYDTIFLV